MTTNYTCAIPDCGKPRRTRGWCSAHYQRWWAHGDPRGGRPTMNGEPMRYLTAHMFDECPKWPFSRSPDGYAQINFNGRPTPTHRVVCVMAHGPAPSPKHEVAHSCGQGVNGCFGARCVRWATSKENNADRHLHGTDSRGERSWTAKLTRADVREIRRIIGTMSYRQIGRQFGVSLEHIYNIAKRRSWSWLP